MDNQTQPGTNKSIWLQVLIAAAVIAILVWVFATGGNNGGNDQPSGGETENGGESQQPETGFPLTDEYTSEQFGFTVTFPEDWHAQDCTDNASTIVALGDREQLIVCSSDAPLNAYMFVGAVALPFWEGTVEDQVAQLGGGIDNMQVTDITVDGVPAKRVQGQARDFGQEGMQTIPPGTTVIHVIFINGDVLYRIYYQDLDNTNRYLDTFDDIVTAFDLQN